VEKQTVKITNFGQTLENLNQLSSVTRECQQEVVRRYLASTSMLGFMLYTTPGYVVNWHHKLICDKIDAWVAGDIKRLMIFTPPRHGKSSIVSERLPAYLLGRFSRCEVVATSYTKDLIVDKIKHAKSLLQSDLYRNIFPSTLVGGKNTETIWETVLGGSCRCAGVDGGLTGFGFDFGIIDDPHKGRKEAESLAVRKGTYDWYRSTFLNRIQAHSRILIIQTRWHLEDLSGTLLELSKMDAKADQWEVVCLPAILDCEPMAGDIRKRGEALWPGRFSLEMLNSMRANSLTYDWESVYQQRPLPAGGGKIKATWFDGKIIEKAPEGLQWSRFWDIAVSTKKTADFTASPAMAEDNDGNIYIRDMLRGQWEWPDTRKLIIMTSALEKCPIGIEVAGQQAGFFQDLLRDDALKGVVIKGYKPDGDKFTRALPWIARAEAGKVYLVRGSWVMPFLDECQKFTGHNDKNDDQIDGVSGGYIMATTLKTKNFRPGGNVY